MGRTYQRRRSSACNHRESRNACWTGGQHHHPQLPNGTCFRTEPLASRKAAPAPYILRRRVVSVHPESDSEPALRRDYSGATTEMGKSRSSPLHGTARLVWRVRLYFCSTKQVGNVRRCSSNKSGFYHCKKDHPRARRRRRCRHRCPGRGHDRPTHFVPLTRLQRRCTQVATQSWSRRAFAAIAPVAIRRVRLQSAHKLSVAPPRRRHQLTTR